MANPKQRHTRGRRDRARKQYDVAPVNTQKCPRCQAPIMSHRACLNCGTYRGKEIMDVTVKTKAGKNV